MAVLLVRDRLTATIAAAEEENRDWRQLDSQDKKRPFSPLVLRPVLALTRQAMGDVGRGRRETMKSTVPTDAVRAWLDSRKTIAGSQLRLCHAESERRGSIPLEAALLPCFLQHEGESP
ncbi:MAG: hypothetical protein HZC55_11930 [Verrucomicrobia bacterium]|nr:hypothetical protein [Verrucomicrobiota bacterium]